MKGFKFIVLIACTLTVVTARAQYYSINIDVKTAAAMASAYATETVAETYYNEQLSKIREHYQAAEVAAAGIFAAKYLDRKALTDLGLWTSSTENYYYRRIYHMVSAKIMPKIWTVAGMMLKSPHNALYWGTYLMKVCEETKTLCYQFESIVTNSRLTFSDIAFLEISQDIADILKLSELGGMDWKGMLDNMSNIGNYLTVDNLKEDINNLYEMGVSLASAGVGNVSGAILQGSTFNGVIDSKIGSVITIADNIYTLYEQLDNDAGEPSSDLSEVRKVLPTCSTCQTIMSPPGLRTMPVKEWDSTILSVGISTDAITAVRCCVTTILLLMTTPSSMVLNGIALPPLILITLRLHPNIRRFSIIQRTMPVGQGKESTS